MTVINLRGLELALGGYGPLGAAEVTVTYVNSKGAAVQVVDDKLIFPGPAVTQILEGDPEQVIDLPPTNGTVAALWSVRKSDYAATRVEFRRLTAIPASGPVDIADLVVVDPKTLAPTSDSIAAWEAVANEVAVYRDETVAARDIVLDNVGDAIESAAAAAESADAAEDSAADAAASQASAAGSATSAGTSATSASGSATAAQTARTGAETARTGAETARAAAETAQTGAQAARTGAEAAQTGAQAARTGAEAARDTALTGQFAGSALGNTDLNTVTTPGVYRQNSQGSALTSVNYPRQSRGILVVHSVQGTGAGPDEVIQTYHAAAPSDAASVYPGYYIRKRNYNTTTWTAWRYMPTQKVVNPTDQPGIELSTWDDINNRDVPLVFTGSALGAYDLNVVTVPGQYFQNNGGNATLVRNYPVTQPGVLEVIKWGSGNFPIQRYTPFPYVTIDGVANAMVGSFIRGVRSNDTWGPWRYQPTMRVTASAGTGVDVLMWDPTNGREQQLMPIQVGAIPGTVDLNTVLTSGIFAQSNTGSATSANNYPVVNGLGVLTVSGTTNTVTQRYQLTTGNSAGRVEYIRRYIVSSATWTTWAAIATQRIVKPSDQPGSEIYTWNDVTNGESQVLGTGIDLGSADLNLVTVSGQYRQNSGGFATLERNYPVANFVGVLEVLPVSNTGSRVLQRATPVAATNPSLNGHWERRIYDGTPGTWFWYSRSNIDKTAGIAVYDYDVDGLRNQLTFGDTGRRDVTSITAAEWTGALIIRRVGSTVFVSAGLNASASVAAGTTIFTMPLGFRPDSTINKIIAGGNIVHGVIADANGIFRCDSGLTALRWYFSYSTNDNWPTSLPGTAIGTIPNL